MRDRITGLEWLAGSAVSATKGSAANAAAACQASNVGGEWDWRLPTRIELLSILDYGLRVTPGPLWPPEMGSAPAGADVFWTSSSAGSNGRYVVDFSSGDVVALDPANGQAFVRCVRSPTALPGAAADPAYASDTDSLVDPATGLRWQAHAAVAGAQPNLPNALSYCASASFDGHGGFRLPSVKELATLVADGRASPALAPPFTAGESGLYWTSSIASYDSSTAYQTWGYDFASGTTTRLQTSSLGVTTNAAQLRVRCVAEAAP
jgi:hypothetical protein